MNSLSFDGLVRLYDETRCFDPACFQKAIQYLSELFPVSQFPRVFEPGIGTGRIAIPMAQKGYEVTGIDISLEMLSALKSVSTPHQSAKRIQCSQADVVNLPFAARGFDLALVVHLFYFIREWKKAAEEILRVIRENGSIVLLHTGSGMEVPALNERYKELCLGQGHRIETLGVKSTRGVEAYYRTLGCHVERIRGQWNWPSRIRTGKALEYLRERAYSFTIGVPEKVHGSVIDQMEDELADQIGKIVEVPNEIYMILVNPGTQGAS